MNRSNRFRIAAALILGLTAISWLFKGIVDTFSGVPGGINNLVLAAAMFFLTLLSWKRPLLGGIISASLAVALAMYFFIILPDLQTAVLPLLLMCAPMAISGLLFIEADWTSKKRN
jgi:hypothetical protein